MKILHYNSGKEVRNEQIKVIYWSQSGNTMSMANAVAEGIKEAGKEAAVLEVSE